MWFTATRAVSGLSGPTSHFARASRRPLLVAGKDSAGRDQGVPQVMARAGVARRPLDRLLVTSKGNFGLPLLPQQVTQIPPGVGVGRVSFQHFAELSLGLGLPAQLD